jgi:hypothetical protein
MAAIRMKWRGEDYVIPAHRAFEIGAEVEGIVTLGEIGTWGNRVPFFKVAKCYGAMLRFAGAKVTDPEVHTEIMANLETAGRARVAGDADPAELAGMAAMNALVACLMGGAPPQSEDAASDAPGKITAS